MVVQGVPALLWSDQVTRQISRNEQNRPPQVLQSTLRIGGEGTPGHYFFIILAPSPRNKQDHWNIFHGLGTNKMKFAAIFICLINCSRFLSGFVINEDN